MSVDKDQAIEDAKILARENPNKCPWFVIDETGNVLCRFGGPPVVPTESTEHEDEIPVYFNADEARGWQSGWDACRRAMGAE